MSERESSPERDTDRIARAVSSVVEQGLSLELTTSDLCFLVALQLRANTSQIASFHEDQLEDVFAHVCELAEAEESESRSITRAIARLREQRVLIRVDGLGVVRAPEYALTRLASAIVEYILEDEILTRESLTVLTKTLLLTLSQIRDAAGIAADEKEWTANVVDPLRVTVRELVRGIERRQRGLDQQQESFQTTIRGLLDADWFGAIGTCQQLLETTSATLRELNELLLQGSYSLLDVLQDIQERALEEGHQAAADAAHLLVDKLDQIVAWGSARQSAWSDYFQYVHRFLRDVVRLDPTRALTERLRQQLAGHTGRPFSLAVASAEPVTLLREVRLPEERPPVTRPKEKREKAPKVEKLGEDPQASLRTDISNRLASGAISLSEVTEKITEDMNRNDRYLHAGRIADAVVTVANPVSARRRPWIRVGGDVLIEDWSIESGEKKASHE